MILRHIGPQAHEKELTALTFDLRDSRRSKFQLTIVAIYDN